MKKGSMKKIVAGALLTSTLGVTACDLTPSATIKFVDINSIEIQNYQVYDEFDATKYVLDITMTDGKTKQVNVTADMIENMPDMTTSGEKTIRVKYEDKYYELKINVGGYSKEEMLAKIQAFLEDYNAVSNPGDVKATITASYLARYMDKVAQGESPEGVVELNKTMTGNDALLNFLYSAIVGSLANSGNDLTVNDITNSNQLTAQLDALKVLKNISEGLLEFDYLDYLADVILETTMFNSLVSTGTDMIMQYFVLSESARAEVTSFVNINIRDFMNYLKSLDFENPTMFDFKGVVVDFNDLVQEFSTIEDIKDIIQSATNSVEGIDKNVLSTFIKEIANKDYRIIGLTKQVWIDNPEIIPEGGYWGFEISNDATTIELEDNIILSVAGVLETMENIVANFFEESPVELNTLITTLTEKLDAYASYQEQIEELELTTSSMIDMSFMIVSSISNNLKDYQLSQDYLDYAIKTIKNNGLVEMLVYSIFNNFQLEGDVNVAFQEIITKLVHDVLDSLYAGEFNGLNSEDYLANICTALGITDTNKIIAYTNEWAQTGFCSIVSDYLQDTIPNGENDEYLGLKSSLVNAIKYLENCLRTSGEKVVEFDFNQALTLANNIFTAIYDLNKAEYDELLANQPSNEPLQPGGVGTMTEYVTLLDLYESALEQIQLFVILTNPEGTMLENINTAISTYKHYVKSVIANISTQLILDQYIIEETESEGVYTINENPLYEVVLAENTLLADYAVEKYLSNQLDMGYVLDEYFKTVDTYAEEDRKIIINSVAIATMIGVGSIQDMDFNEVFSFIKLPDSIEAIDYNKLVETFYDVETYKNMFTVSKVDVKYETNSQGEIAKEIMQIEFNFNYDLKITELKANLTLKVEIDF